MLYTCYYTVVLFTWTFLLNTRFINSENISQNSSSVFAHQNILSAAPLKLASLNTTSLLYSTSTSNYQLKNRTNLYLIDSSEESETTKPPDYKEYSDEIELESDEKLIRIKLCPQESNGRQAYLYDPTIKMCSIVGQKGHCGKNMAFYPEFNSTTFGYCECDFRKFKIPLVYHNKTNICYSIYTQAYCPTNHWLIFNKENHPTCEPSLCENEKKKKTLKVPLNGNGPCVKLSKGSSHCSSSEEIIQFVGNQTFPTCGLPIKSPSFRLLSPINQRSCPPGSFVSLSGRCQSSWSW